MLVRVLVPVPVPVRAQARVRVRVRVQFSLGGLDRHRWWQGRAPALALVPSPGNSGSALAIKPSTMRIEYKVADKKTGVVQRVMLTPQSQVADLQRAESILVRPHDD